MAEKKIASVECEIPGGFSEYVSIDSDTSLLDWDIILFRPNISKLLGYPDTYQGKPSLADYASFQLRERMEHWRRELRDAIDSGKTVITFLSELDEVYIDTGQRQYSGTGRNRQTTRVVDLYNNYKCIPFTLGPINAKGSEMRLAKGSELLSTYWAEFGDNSTYRVRIEGQVSKPLVITRTGDKTVGALIRVKNSAGALLLLPYLELELDEFYRKTKGGKLEWTEKSRQFGHRLLAAIIEIDRTLKQVGALTPIPNWAKLGDYNLPKEAKLKEKLLKIDEDLEKLQQQKQRTKEELTSEGVLRRLLFEKGSALEEAILQALHLLGFAASKYRDSDSEFDVVFQSSEGRFLGEAEGKDNNMIGIDKLRQLEMNIHEDLAREEVIEPAKGVLFGNAYRLLALNERGEFFTEKCLKSAKRSGTILVRTPDLFRVAQYLSGETDQKYAQACRKALLNAEGEIVQFPKPPSVELGTINIKEIT